MILKNEQDDEAPRVWLLAVHWSILKSTACISSGCVQLYTKSFSQNWKTDFHNIQWTVMNSGEGSSREIAFSKKLKKNSNFIIHWSVIGHHVIFMSFEIMVQSLTHTHWWGNVWLWLENALSYHLVSLGANALLAALMLYSQYVAACVCISQSRAYMRMCCASDLPLGVL